MSMIRRFLARIFTKVREVFTIVAKGVAKDVLAILNDAELQSLAVDACARAAALGLRGDAAWKHAFDDFGNQLRLRGRELATNLAETLLQTAYTVWKATGKL